MNKLQGFWLEVEDEVYLGQDLCYIFIISYKLTDVSPPQWLKCALVTLGTLSCHLITCLPEEGLSINNYQRLTGLPPTLPTGATPYFLRTDIVEKILRIIKDPLG